MNEESKENGFFRWVRELDLRRGEDNWIGGVASGLGQRFGISTVLVRGIIVALCFVAGLGVLLYGIGWALMPGPDGRIHLQEAIAGRWSSGMSGALVFFILGAAGSPTFRGHNGGFFGWWDGGLWTLLVIGAICYLIFSRRGRFEPGARPQAPGTPDPFNTSPGAGFDSGSGTGFGTGGDTVEGTSWSGTAAPDPTTPFTSGPTGTEPRASGAMVVPGSDLDVPGPEKPAGPTGASPAGKQESTTPDAPTVPLHGNKNTGDLPKEDKTMPTRTPDASGTTEPKNPGKPDSAKPGTPSGPARDTHRASGAGFGPPAPPTPPPSTGSTVPAPQPPRPARSKAIPGYVATIVLGLAVIAFALVTGLEHLGMFTFAANPFAVGFAVALVIIALGVIGAAVSNRTGGALTGFGIVALVFALVWGGGALRDGGPIPAFAGISTTESGRSTHVFHSGELDLRSYSTITSDTSVKIDNVFSSMKLTVPDNIPVAIESRDAFTSLKVEGSSTQLRDGATVLNPGTTGPTLYLQLDGAFNSIEINVEKAEVAP